MSLFFNTGPRRNGKHKNRWVPVQVSADTLASRNCLKVHSNHLSYRHAPENNVSDLSVYIVDEFIFLNTEVILHSETEDTVYTVELSSSSVDQLDKERFTSTCVIIESTASPDCPGLRKGACFYVQPKQRSDSRMGASGRNDIVETSVLDLTFNCPIRLWKSLSSEVPGAGQEQVYGLNRINGARDIRIHYGLLFPSETSYK